jgi:4-amino-4-deoxy-L-arabinose transferase-like glycosyltransferase
MTKKLFSGFLEKPIQLLSIILFFALALRLWGIWFGLPYIYHHDEGHEVLRALQLGMGSFNFERVAKGGYFYVLFVEYGILFIVLKLTGFIQSTTDFALLYFRDPSIFYLVGRVTTALIGVLNVYLVFYLGKIAYSRNAGLLAALFLVFNSIHAESSQSITVDVPLTCLMTAALIFAIHIKNFGGASNYYWGATVAGLAFITKLPGVMVLIPLLLGHWYYISKQETSKKTLNHFFSKKLIISGLIFSAVTVIGNPGIIVNFVSLIRFIFTSYAGDSSDALEEISQDEPVNLFLFYFDSLEESMGLILLIVSLIAVIYSFFRRREEDIILIVFLISFYLAIALFDNPSLRYPRYILPMIPVLAVLSGRVLQELIAKTWPHRLNFILSIIAVLLILEPGYTIVLRNNVISHKDTRTYAVEWIEKNIPAGSKILIEGTSSKVIKSTVPLRNSWDNIEQELAVHKSESPSRVKLYRKFYEMEFKARSNNTYTLELVGPWTRARDIPIQDLSYYKKKGVEYFVLRSDVYHESVRLGKVFLPFLEQLKNDPEVSLIKKIENNPFNRPGPTIEIYRYNR